MDFLRRSGITLVPGELHTYNTACGYMEFRDYTIDAISFGGIEYGPFTVSETEGENLLGMDILSSFGPSTSTSSRAASNSTNYGI